ncbi:MAG: excinuclease ABC subunit UvrB [bacterium]
MSDFQLQAPYPPRGDQPQAVEAVARGLREGLPEQTILGVTGSGKTFVMANVIAALSRPALVISHNKTLAAQLAGEFREFFPHNAVEYFVSYYDYYQPEAYIPQSDTYIEKDSDINQDIDRLRHAATQAVLERRDAIVVASVSCIYGLGSPEDYMKTILVFRLGDEVERASILKRLVEMQFTRSTATLARGQFRLRGDVLEIAPADEENVVRMDFFGDAVEKISVYDPVSGHILAHKERLVVYPAKHFITPLPKLKAALTSIEQELEDRLRYFRDHEMLLEAQRIEQRTRYDMEMLREIGYCSGIENYSRHLTGRAPGQPPATLIDYFPEDFIVFIDESHVTIPQLHAMRHGDRSRKDSLINYGFRLPSAYDNRPLSFEEFRERIGQVVYVSATPGPYELKVSRQVAELIVRPTGIVDPEIVIRPVAGEVEDLLAEIRKRAASSERVLVTTLTKKMAEDLSEYLAQAGIKVRYLHSDIDTLDRIQILRDLRLGTFDVLVGINLLREGLDLPEVSLVAILDADKEGFLRSETSLIQTIGRAARNISGTVILYADKMTGSINRAVDETMRRRRIQLEYNKTYGIIPETIRKSVRDILESLAVSEPETAYKVKEKESLSVRSLEKLIRELDRAMKEAAKKLEFEKAAALRDEMYEARKSLSEKLKNAPIGPVALSLPGRRRRPI